MADAILFRGTVVREKPGRVGLWETLRVFFASWRDTGRWIAESPESMETVIRIGIANM